MRDEIVHHYNALNVESPEIENYNTLKTKVNKMIDKYHKHNFKL